jgi:ATPase subunit of ABC transporter with duplicated ATPase domains
MSLLSASNLAFRYPSQADPLFQEASFVVNPGDRIALVGPNGSGKTTLLRILAGEFEPVLRQNAIMMHSPQKQRPKDRSLGPSLGASASGP